MATPSASSILNFVKKYPITLCGFSLLFMPSVHRLLLYFTPLLLSTAIFIVAMLTWGPGAMSSDQRGTRRGRRNDWAFNGSLKIYEGEEEEEGAEEEEEEEVAEVSQRTINDGNLQEKDISIKGKESKKLQDPNPDFGEESNRMETTSTGAIFYRGQGEPDPDLGGDGVGAVSNGAIYGAQAEPLTDLGGDGVGTVSNGAIYGAQTQQRTDLGGDCLGTASCIQAEPDPDFHGDGVDSHAEPDLAGDCVGTASHEAPAAERAEPDPDFHGEQHVEAAHDQDFSAEQHLHAAAPNHHHLHDHAKGLAPISPDQLQAAGDHLNYDGFGDYDDAESNHTDDYHDAEPDPDLHGEGAAGAVHAKSEGAHGAQAQNDVKVENDDLHEQIFAELRQKLGVNIKRTPYSTDDARDPMHSQKLAERLQTLMQAAA